MEISELTLKLILLLIPGSIACIIYERLTIHKRWTSFKFITNAILFGGISYLLAQVIFNICGGDSTFDSFWENLPTKEIPFSAILKASLIAIFVGLASTAIDHYKLINRFGKWLRLTNKYGDENLYSYFLNAKDVEEIYVRDIENDLTYHGLIDSFSENEEIKELVLRDVVVYRYKNSEQLYEIDKLYLSKSKESLIIELPYKD
ncbi:hypothetical protein L0P88_21900 [Muricauda sp. SCSIO 64092]|uniref:hypothetical protein n=1 Tax=Allomuricauda sp. SCSIO 64092 TaxID=2908842 RepID=UPI001FF3C2C2|nr:hypothetical protein [Muricauda sp. SCSIO 64092]UOY06563.1 hypothetical protein L0P88_21900 [Muricauda sp. SCSIO 64092]